MVSLVMFLRERCFRGLLTVYIFITHCSCFATYGKALYFFIIGFENLKKTENEK